MQTSQAKSREASPSIEVNKYIGEYGAILAAGECNFPQRTQLISSGIAQLSRISRGNFVLTVYARI